MKFLIILFILFQGLFNYPAVAKDRNTGEVWGRIIKFKPNEQLYGFKYFVVFETDKKNHAYPVEIKDESSKRKIERVVNKFARITGEIKKIRIQKDGESHEIIYFTPQKIMPLSLGDLAVNTDQSISITKNNRYLTKNNKGNQKGGIRVSDNVANTIIFTSGALLLGSILRGL